MVTAKLSLCGCRLSLSWTRIVPGGFKGSPVNTEGVKFYKQLLQGLKYVNSYMLQLCGSEGVSRLASAVGLNSSAATLSVKLLLPLS